MSESYHNAIQEAAKRIEQEREKTYQIHTKGQNLRFTEQQYSFIHAAMGKLIRVRDRVKIREKAMDEIIDIYNFMALLYDDLAKEDQK
jgi:uncharacterized coiled-coil DUF342 family protein